MSQEVRVRLCGRVFEAIHVTECQFSQKHKLTSEQCYVTLVQLTRVSCSPTALNVHKRAIASQRTIHARLLANIDCILLGKGGRPEAFALRLLTGRLCVYCLVTAVRNSVFLTPS
jgi:hypothetical protein